MILCRRPCMASTKSHSQPCHACWPRVGQFRLGFPVAPCFFFQTAGLRGGIAPLGDYWDPAGLSEGKDFLEVKMWREAELKHGRLAMLAVVGLPFAEFWHPLAPDYDGNALGMITQPQILVCALLINHEP